jgi:inorganic pyrophosphatase
MHFFAELRNFFEEYKKLEKKTVVVDEFQEKDKAHHIIKEAIERYNTTFK